jgi:exodeoxyribonuclease VII small subunit
MAKSLKQVQPKNFEQAISELETLLNAMEGGNVPLEESLVRYERGTYLIEYCRQVLGHAELQIKKITDTPAVIPSVTPGTENIVSAKVSDKTGTPDATDSDVSNNDVADNTPDNTKVGV